MSRFIYEASGRQVAEVLRDFGAAQGLPVLSSEGVEGVVRGRFDNSPTEFLDALCRSFGLIWYHDGAALYVYPANAIRSRLFRLQGFDSRRIEALRAKLTWGDGRYPLKYSPGEKTLLVTGPPRHIELVSQLVEVLDAESSERLRQVIEVVPLKFASAASNTVNGAVQAGLAETMQKLFDDTASIQRLGPLGGANPGMLGETPEARIAAAQATPRVLDMLAGKSRRSDTVAPVSMETSRGLQSPLSLPDKPRFVADAHSNSVIISGSPLRMAYYVETLRKLDVEPLQIELEALILDVSSDQSETLGLSWSVSAGSAKTVPGARWGTGAATKEADASLNVLAYWASAGAAIQAKLNAMAQDGRAKLVSRPKVVATVNLPATLANQQRVSAKVAGNLEARIYSIDTGMSIQVTPQAYLVDGLYRIRLSLSIEDGALEDRMVDGVPIVRRTQVTTDVRMTEGESVVLGGIAVESERVDRSGVPWLKDLPFVGPLFRTTGTAQKKSERLFMITPRVIPPTRLSATQLANATPVALSQRP
ncbi:secretin N-terminal domain-containing protein [Ideonella sp.]|jgi:type III secretion protein C|uniref:secretin N-terminal domain-containing protein n=1 Tax=Ideonella sp. TaxID=1929293 RepID=UPI0037C02E66